MADKNLNLAVLDMQPILPAVGGGRLRLLGLYHGLGPGMEVHYVGTYDWRGPGYRRQMLSEGLEELLIPLSEEHFVAADARARATGGRVVIDCIFPELAHLSPQYVEAARQAVGNADVVVFSHPWVHPLVRNLLDPSRQLIVYDSHNVEGLLRMELLDDGAAGTAIVRDVIRVESELCHAAHLILACSHEDRASFNRLYGIPYERMRIFPNGTFTEKLLPATPDQKAAARKELEIGETSVAFFIGSNYAPNAQAADFIVRILAPALPHILFVVAGGVGEALAGRPLPHNLRAPGLVFDDKRNLWLHAADIGINPMFGGSGTNIKMLDYMAAGLPIVTTAIGARGIETSQDSFATAEAKNFGTAIDSLLGDKLRARALADSARRQATMFYSWERISSELGLLLERDFEALGRKRPFFSVVVPTFERHGLLDNLVANLATQTDQDFETIIIDQSSQPWPRRYADHGRDIFYVHTDIKGPGFARNSGAKFARGKVIAFVDDDCEPLPDWLSGARTEFETQDIVGVEGLVQSARMGDPEWRAVTNDGFEGMGFMTANLFILSEVFQSINGFDVAFGDLPFREDTDLGWRAQEKGKIAFSRKARVYHPPQSRSLLRESLESRSRFFERDALLLRKHPKKYAQLMRCERQWLENPHFWPRFFAGLERYAVELPDEVRLMIPWHIRPKARTNQR